MFVERNGKKGKKKNRNSIKAWYLFQATRLALLSLTPYMSCDGKTSGKERRNPLSRSPEACMKHGLWPSWFLGPGLDYGFALWWEGHPTFLQEGWEPGEWAGTEPLKRSEQITVADTAFPHLPGGGPASALCWPHVSEASLAEAMALVWHFFSSTCSFVTPSFV